MIWKLCKAAKVVHRNWSDNHYNWSDTRLPKILRTDRLQEFDDFLHAPHHHLALSSDANDTVCGVGTTRTVHLDACTSFLKPHTPQQNGLEYAFHWCQWYSLWSWDNMYSTPWCLCQFSENTHITKTLPTLCLHCVIRDNECCDWPSSHTLSQPLLLILGNSSCSTKNPNVLFPPIFTYTV